MAHGLFFEMAGVKPRACATNAGGRLDLLEEDSGARGKRLPRSIYFVRVRTVIEG